MNRQDVIEQFAEVRSDAPVIVGPGASSGALYHTDHREATIYNMEMGYATAICLGLALAAPDQRVVAVEGDGSMVMGMGVFTTIARYSPPNLIVLIVDNGRYGTTGFGNVQTVTDLGLNLAELAAACGIPSDQTRDATKVEELRVALREAMASPGPWIVRAQVDQDPPVKGPKRIPELDIVETAIAFRQEMARRLSA